MRKFKFASPQTVILPTTTTALRACDTAPDAKTTKRTRKSIFKVRTGCLTCKKRHLKCDEARPHCGNCVRSSKACEGYPVVEGKRRNGKPLQHCWDAGVVVAATAPRPTSQMRLDPDLCDFSSGQSKTYFDAFVTLLRSPWVVATSNGYLWGTTMPQVSRSSGILREIAIAIGALSMALDADESTSKSNLYSAREHRIRALQHYGHSLKQLRAEPSVHDAVFLSLLSLRFETLQGNNRAALDHVNHGLAVVASLLIDGKGMTALAPNPKPVIVAVAAVFTQLAPQARFIHRGRIQRTMAKDNSFVKKLAEKGHTLESFVILASHLLPRSSRHDDIPDKITSLDEFERHLSIQRRRLTNVPVGNIDNNEAYAAMATNDTDLIDGYYLSRLTSDALKQGYETVLRDLEKLDAAFLPLFNTITANNQPPSPVYLRALHLRLLFLQVYGFENPTQYLDHEALARQTPLFREYVLVARAALTAAGSAVTSPAQKGSLECNVAGHLMLAALFCRDQLVRDEATQVLSTYPGHDGLWNTRGLYLVAVKSQEVERATVAATAAEGGGLVEQWSRMWRREYIFEDGGNRILYRHLRKDEASGEWRLVEEVADVPDDISGEVCWRERPMIGYSKLIMGIMDE